MSDETATPRGSEPETPVGDMTEEGQTELGPHPALTNVENWDEGDLEQAAEGQSEGQPGQDE